VDFAFSDDATALRDLAREILQKETPPELLRAVEASEDEWFARDVWRRLAEAQLLGAAVPEEHGGSGLGFVELCLLCQEVGRAVAPLPALATLVLGALPLARLGSEAQRARWLPGVAAGEVVLTAALVDPDAAEIDAPAATARRDGAGWVLEGRKQAVPFAAQAERVLVPAAADGGVGLFLVDRRQDGVTVAPRRISTGERLSALALRGVRVEEDARLGDPAGGAEALAWLRDAALVALSATQLGVCERALEITAGYVSQREQFGRPIGTFQAVQHRAADAAIDCMALRWTTWRAAWRVDAGLPASREAAVAKFWAADAGARIAASCQHLHGGMGADRDYPLHRYVLWSKALELALGAATPQLVRLGRDLARTGSPEAP